MADSDFNELLHAAEQLTANTESSGELPKVERTLRQVLEASTELWSRVSQSGANDLQAHLLLGSKGVDLPLLSRKLEVLSARKTFEPLEPIPDTDIHRFLKNERENAILSVIEETHQNTFKNTHDQQWESISNDWNEEKVKLFKALLATSSKTYTNVPAQHEEESLVCNFMAGPRSCLNNQEMAYVAQVSDHNKIAGKGGHQESLVEKLTAAAATFKDKNVSDLWEMVKFMIKYLPEASGDVITTRSRPKVQNKLVYQARKYLEERYKKYMVSVVMENLKQARLGGVPGTYPLVRSFVGIRIPSNMLGLEDGQVDGRPFWPVVYFSLRCGDIPSAMHCARQAGQRMDELCSFLEELNASESKRLSPRLEEILKFQYMRSIRTTTDPFKRAAYCIIGSCDPDDDHAQIAQAADDYLWLKLCQIHEEDTTEPRSTDRMSYRQFQSVILEDYGETHYKAMDHPHVYFQVLFLTGQFEAAIEFLARVDGLRVHAVHIAIALNELNLLGMPEHIQAPLLSTDPNHPPARRLNMARLVMMYVHKFELSNIREAMQYYYVLRRITCPDGKNVFMSSISDLAMESRQFDLILGKMNKDGVCIPGLISTFHDTQADSTPLVEMVAAGCEMKGWFEDAIKLYDLANNQEKVLSLMTVMLSQVVTERIKPDSLRTRLQLAADMIHNRYAGKTISCSADISAAFHIMRDLLIFFDQYHAQEFQMALATIGKSNFIPLAAEELDECINKFKRLTDEICRTLPDILLATMNMLYSEFNKLKGIKANDTSTVQFEDRIRDQEIVHLREKARVLTNFAGTVSYRMPGDTNARLVQMEILMH